MDHLSMDHAHGAADGQEETGHGHNEQAMQHAGGHDHMAMMEADARKTRWTHFGVIGLGDWLAASPLVYDGVKSEAVSDAVRADPVDRGLPPVEWRAGIMMARDLSRGPRLMLLCAM